MPEDETRTQEPSPPGESGLSAWVYLRALGLVYLAAFASFWVQLEGLVGPEGILPAAETMQAVRQTPHLSFFDFPTWCWWGAGSAALHLQAALGVACSLLLVAGVANAPLLLFTWSLYLSFATIGRIFMGYQWDNLLLEAGLLAPLLAPAWAPLARRRPATPKLATLLHRFLVFRLMFSSGFVKLASGDPSWRELGAMKYHFETQPIPTGLSWYAHRLPEFALEATVLLVFVEQLVLPFLLFGPRRVRHFAAAGLALLQLLILLTGNYGFFNLLALALLLTCFDDLAIASRMPARFVAWWAARPVLGSPGGRWPLVGRVTSGVAAVTLGLLALLVLAGTLGLPIRGEGVTGRVLGALAPYRSVNPYGLFAVMTTERPEIQLEGSEDGVIYEPYVFEHKAGPLDRSPRLILPHMPRLDWQMWFAALGTAERNPWLGHLVRAMLEARPPVLGLFAHDPFEGRAPRFVRATLWNYRFTSWEERRASGEVWRRVERGFYFSAVEAPR